MLYQKISRTAIIHPKQSQVQHVLTETTLFARAFMKTGEIISWTPDEIFQYIVRYVR